MNARIGDGGAGYIGSHTVRRLREYGATVVVLDTLELGHRAAIDGAVLVEGSISDEGLLERLFISHAIEAVFHFAAYKAAGESMEYPARYFGNNVAGTLSLLRAMRKTGVGKIVFSSSCAVYGTPEVLPVSETHPLHPESPYAESKRMAEQMLHWFDVCHGLRYVNLRYFNAAGAALDGTTGEDSTFALNLIPVVMKAALGKIPVVRVFGTDYDTPDGTAIRDYIHVLDLADAHVRALAYLDQHMRSEIFNLGTGRPTSVQQVIDMVRQVSGVAVPVEYTTRRPGDPAAVWADASKACALLGWQPHYGLEEIVRGAWQWHSTHPAGYHDAGS